MDLIVGRRTVESYEVCGYRACCEHGIHLILHGLKQGDSYHDHR